MKAQPSKTAAPWVLEVLFTREEIEKRIQELAAWVNATYAHSKDLVIIGFLKGSIPFLAQLIKDLTVLYTLDFMTVSTYGGVMSSTNNLKIIMDLKQDIVDKDVLVIEDIVDSGLTLSKMTEYLKTHHPKSLRVLTLLDKPQGRKLPFQPDAYGFKVPNAFLVGYGLDVKEKLRGLPYIGIFDKSRFDDL